MLSILNTKKNITLISQNCLYYHNLKHFRLIPEENLRRTATSLPRLQVTNSTLVIFFNRLLSLNYIYITAHFVSMWVSLNSNITWHRSATCWLTILGASEISANLYCYSRTSVLGFFYYLRLLMKRMINCLSLMNYLTLNVEKTFANWHLKWHPVP